MAEVICVGVVFLDHVFRVDDATARGHRLFAGDYTATGGGMAATAAVAVSRLGGRAALWARLGDDAAGRLILDELARWSVDTTAVKVIAGARSPTSSVTVDAAGECRLVIYPGEGLDPSPDGLPLTRIEEASAVPVDTRWPAGAEAVLARAADHRVPALLDGEVGPVSVPALLVAQASHTVFSRDGLAQFTGIEDVARGLAAAARRTRGVVGTTAGAAGFYWFEPGIWCSPPAGAGGCGRGHAGRRRRLSRRFCPGARRGQGRRDGGALCQRRCLARLHRTRPRRDPRPGRRMVDAGGQPAKRMPGRVSLRPSPVPTSRWALPRAD